VETWDAIRSRRNVRSYAKRAIAPQDLDRILEAARRTPSAGNQQAWDFVVCINREQLTQLARVGPAGHVAGAAATIALVAPGSDDARMHDLVWLDLGQATMSVMLAAADLGIGRQAARRRTDHPHGPPHRPHRPGPRLRRHRHHRRAGRGRRRQDP
jgi:nitroreductase